MITFLGFICLSKTFNNWLSNTSTSNKFALFPGNQWLPLPSNWYLDFANSSKSKDSIKFESQRRTGIFIPPGVFCQFGKFLSQFWYHSKPKDAIDTFSKLLTILGIYNLS